MNEDLVPVKNNTAMTMHVAGVLIAPGETRHLPRVHVPANLLPRTTPAAVPAPSDPVLELLDDSVKDIVGRLPELDDEQLAAVKAAEVDGKTRKSLMDAIAQEELRRANARADGAGQGDGEGDGAGSPDTE